MKEKYDMGYTDPEAIYGSTAVKLEEPVVRWEFLERNQYNIAAVVAPLVGLAVVIGLVVLL